LNIGNSNLVIYNVFQIESLKRICLLKHIVDEKYEESINRCLKTNEEILKTNQMEIYSTIAFYKEQVKSL